MQCRPSTTTVVNSYSRFTIPLFGSKNAKMLIPQMIQAMSEHIAYNMKLYRNRNLAVLFDVLFHILRLKFCPLFYYLFCFLLCLVLYFVSCLLTQ